MRAVSQQKVLAVLAKQADEVKAARRKAAEAEAAAKQKEVEEGRLDQLSAIEAEQARFDQDGYTDEVPLLDTPPPSPPFLSLYSCIFTP